MSAVEGRPPAKEMMEGSADTWKSSSRNDTGARESLVANGNCRVLTCHHPDRTDRNIYPKDRDNRMILHLIPEKGKNFFVHRPKPGDLCGVSDFDLDDL